ncbi:MAG: hypothetical protein WDO24_13605 [Pseudomonadota bacterium]
MRSLLLAAASSAVLAWSSGAWAQVDTSAQAYRAINGETTTSYGSSGAAQSAGSNSSADTGWFSGLTIISPNDPTYSYTEPPHAGQPQAWELNGDDHGRGTSYPAILGHDGE